MANKGYEPTFEPDPTTGLAPDQPEATPVSGGSATEPPSQAAFEELYAAQVEAGIPTVEPLPPLMPAAAPGVLPPYEAPPEAPPIEPSKVQADIETGKLYDVSVPEKPVEVRLRAGRYVPVKVPPKPLAAPAVGVSGVTGLVAGVPSVPGVGAVPEPLPRPAPKPPTVKAPPAKVYDPKLIAEATTLKDAGLTAIETYDKLILAGLPSSTAMGVMENAGYGIIGIGAAKPDDPMTLILPPGRGKVKVGDIETTTDMLAAINRLPEAERQAEYERMGIIKPPKEITELPPNIRLDLTTGKYYDVSDPSKPVEVPIGEIVALRRVEIVPTLAELVAPPPLSLEDETRILGLAETIAAGKYKTDEPTPEQVRAVTEELVQLDWKVRMTTTELPDGNRINNLELTAVKEDAPLVYTALVEDGLEAANVIIGQQQTAEYEKALIERAELELTNKFIGDQYMPIKDWNDLPPAWQEIALSKGFDGLDSSVAEAETTLEPFKVRKGAYNVEKALLLRDPAVDWAAGMLFTPETLAEIQYRKAPGLSIGVTTMPDVKEAPPSPVAITPAGEEGLLLEYMGKFRDFLDKYAPYQPGAREKRFKVAEKRIKDLHQELSAFGDSVRTTAIDVLNKVAPYQPGARDERLEAVGENIAFAKTRYDEILKSATKLSDNFKVLVLDTLNKIAPYQPGAREERLEVARPRVEELVRSIKNLPESSREYISKLIDLVDKIAPYQPGAKEERIKVANARMKVLKDTISDISKDVKDGMVAVIEKLDDIAPYRPGAREERFKTAEERVEFAKERFDELLAIAEKRMAALKDGVANIQDNVAELATLAMGKLDKLAPYKPEEREDRIEVAKETIKHTGKVIDKAYETSMDRVIPIVVPSISLEGVTDPVLLAQLRTQARGEVEAELLKMDPGTISAWIRYSRGEIIYPFMILPIRQTLDYQKFNLEAKQKVLDFIIDNQPRNFNIDRVIRLIKEGKFGEAGLSPKVAAQMSAIAVASLASPSPIHRAATLYILGLLGLVAAWYGGRGIQMLIGAGQAEEAYRTSTAPTITVADIPSGVRNALSMPPTMEAVGISTLYELSQQDKYKEIIEGARRESENLDRLLGEYEKSKLPLGRAEGYPSVLAPPFPPSGVIVPGEIAEVGAIPTTELAPTTEFFPAGKEIAEIPLLVPPAIPPVKEELRPVVVVGKVSPLVPGAVPSPYGVRGYLPHYRQPTITIPGVGDVARELTFAERVRYNMRVAADYYTAARELQKAEEAIKPKFRKIYTRVISPEEVTGISEEAFERLVKWRVAQIAGLDVTPATVVPEIDLAWLSKEFNRLDMESRRSHAQWIQSRDLKDKQEAEELVRQRNIIDEAIQARVKAGWSVRKEKWRRQMEEVMSKQEASRIVEESRRYAARIEAMVASALSQLKELPSYAAYSDKLTAFSNASEQYVNSVSPQFVSPDVGLTIGKVSTALGNMISQAEINTLLKNAEQLATTTIQKYQNQGLPITDVMSQTATELYTSLNEQLASMNLSAVATQTITDAATQTALSNAVQSAVQAQTMTQTQAQTATNTMTAARTAAKTATRAVTRPATRTAARAITRAIARPITAVSTLTVARTARIPRIGIPIIPLPQLGEIEEEPTKIPRGSITWGQGIFWKYIPPPWDQNKPITLKYPPVGAKNTDSNVPSETIQMIGKPRAKVPYAVNIDLGIADIAITKGGKSIKFTGKGLETDVGRRMPSTTQGMSLEEDILELGVAESTRRPKRKVTYRPMVKKGKRVYKKRIAWDGNLAELTGMRKGTLSEITGI